MVGRASSVFLAISKDGEKVVAGLHLIGHMKRNFLEEFPFLFAQRSLVSLLLEILSPFSISSCRPVTCKGNSRKARRTVMSPAGVHVSDFSSLWEWMVVFLDITLGMYCQSARFLCWPNFYLFYSYLIPQGTKEAPSQHFVHKYSSSTPQRRYKRHPDPIHSRLWSVQDRRNAERVRMSRWIAYRFWIMVLNWDRRRLWIQATKKRKTKPGKKVPPWILRESQAFERYSFQFVHVSPLIRNFCKVPLLLL